MNRTSVLCLSTLLFLLLACEETPRLTAVPQAKTLTADAIGHYCNMGLLEHQGPKAQIHLQQIDDPLWFSQVRDAIAYLRSPEETLESVATYVNDMGVAESWDSPGINNWIALEAAYFVIGSQRSGGMGAPEPIPFGAENSAQEFARAHGGEVVRLAGIPDEYVLGPVDILPPTMQ